MLQNLSSKYLSLEALSSLCNEENPNNYDGVALLTASGLIIGKIKTNLQKSEGEVTVAQMIEKLKKQTISDIEKETNSQVDLSDNGSMITVENGFLKSENLIANFLEITIFCEDVIGFLPVNVSESLKNLEHNQSVRL